MELKLDERQLLAHYHRLTQEGKKELLDFASFLAKKYHNSSPAATGPDENQCGLNSEGELRPEAVKEPIFTE
jgi:hypothetical protein